MRVLSHDPSGTGAARRLLVAGTILAACLGWAVESAEGAYTAKVTNGRLVITGNGASDQLALRLESGVPTTLQVDVGNNGSANFSFDRGLLDRIVVNAGGGNDTVVIDQANGAFTDPTVVSVPAGEATTLNGETGNDALLGGAGRQVLAGGPGNDTVDGNQGDDLVNLGDGSDTARWDPGDGNDVVNGQGGVDTLDFDGSAAAEAVDLSATGQRLRLFRNIANIVLDVGTLERVALEALGGADLITLQNLRATPITRGDRRPGRRPGQRRGGRSDGRRHLPGLGKAGRRQRERLGRDDDRVGPPVLGAGRAPRDGQRPPRLPRLARGSRQRQRHRGGRLPERHPDLDARAGDRPWLPGPGGRGRRCDPRAQGPRRARIPSTPPAISPPSGSRSASREGPARTS